MYCLVVNMGNGAGEDQIRQGSGWVRGPGIKDPEGIRALFASVRALGSMEALT